MDKYITIEEFEDLLNGKFWENFWQSHAFDTLAPPEDDMVYENRRGCVIMNAKTYLKIKDGENSLCSYGERKEKDG